MAEIEIKNTALKVYYFIEIIFESILYAIKKIK